MQINKEEVSSHLEFLETFQYGFLNAMQRKYLFKKTHLQAVCADCLHVNTIPVLTLTLHAPLFYPAAVFTI